MVLALKNVRKAFGEVTVLDIRDFAVSRGEHLAIAGPSGAGKTTLLNIISGLLDPDEGEVCIDGTDITKLSGRRRDRFRGAKIGFVFQTFNLLQGFTALENLLVALMFGPLPRREHEARAREMLQRVGLADHMHKRPAQLSVGQQQRVAIARALVNRPPLVLADEPAAQLDEQNARSAVSLLKEVCEGVTLLVVAHDPVVLGAFPKTIDIRGLK